MRNTYSKIKGKVVKRHRGGEIKTTGDLLADALATVQYAKETIPDPVDDGLADYLGGQCEDIIDAANALRSALLTQPRL